MKNQGSSEKNSMLHKHHPRPLRFNNPRCSLFVPLQDQMQSHFDGAASSSRVVDGLELSKLDDLTLIGLLVVTPGEYSSQPNLCEEITT